MRPKAKNVSWQRNGGELRLLFDQREQLQIPDADGRVEALLTLLREGTREIADLGTALDVPEEDVRAAVSTFDELGLLEDAERQGRFSAEHYQRYFSNLAFFEIFGSLERSSEDFQADLRTAHVLVLGTGGLNSNTVPHLAALGVGQLTLVDKDEVEPKNFARQYLYRHEDIGKSKVRRAEAWVRAYDPEVRVQAHEMDIDGPERVTDVVATVRPDVVMSGVDTPYEVDTWVNAACVANDVPMVRGGMSDSTGLVWSVHPRHSGCWSCKPSSAEGARFRELQGLRGRVNRGIGPVAGLLGSLCAFEVLRYLTGYEPPAHAAAPLFVDFARGCEPSRREAWARDPTCTVCGGMGSRKEVN